MHNVSFPEDSMILEAQKEMDRIAVLGPGLFGVETSLVEGCLEVGDHDRHGVFVAELLIPILRAMPTNMPLRGPESDLNDDTPEARACAAFWTAIQPAEISGVGDLDVPFAINDLPINLSRA